MVFSQTQYRNYAHANNHFLYEIIFEKHPLAIVFNDSIRYYFCTILRKTHHRSLQNINFYKAQ